MGPGRNKPRLRVRSLGKGERELFLDTQEDFAFVAPSDAYVTPFWAAGAPSCGLLLLRMTCQSLRSAYLPAQSKDSGNFYLGLDEN